MFVAVSRGFLAAAALSEDGTSSRRSVRHTRPFMAMFAASKRTRKGSCYSSEARRSGGPSTDGSSTGRTLRRRARGQDRHRRLHRHPDDALRPGSRPISCRPSQAVPLPPATSPRATDDSRPSDLMRLTFVHFVVLVENPASTRHQTSRTLPRASPTQRHVWAREGVVVRARTRALRGG